MFTPDEHIDIIKNTKRPGGKGLPFTVNKMEQEDFQEHEILKRLVTMRAQKTGCRFSDSCYFRVSNQYRIGFKRDNNYGSLFDKDMPASQQRLNKGKDNSQINRQFSLNVNIPRKYNGILQLNSNKSKDLHELVDNILGPIDPDVIDEEAFDEPDSSVPIDEMSSRSHVDYV